MELGDLGPALRELLADRGAIMLTAHFGNFELLGYAIARLGLPLVAVMRPLDNPLLNDYLMSSREASGLSLLYKKGATASAQQALDDKATLCYIADQNAGRKGVFVDFFPFPAGVPAVDFLVRPVNSASFAATNLARVDRSSSV